MHVMHEHAFILCWSQTEPKHHSVCWLICGHTLQMSELLQSLLARTTGPDGTSTESRETHGQDDREEHPANKEAGTRVELVDLT